jgi:diguanylate cyclase (GGDEF)-like protein
MKEFGRNRGSARGSFIVDGKGMILGFDEGMEALTDWPAIEVVGHHKDLRPAAGSDELCRGPSRALPLYDGHIPIGSHPGSFRMSLNCRSGRRLDVQCSVRKLSGSGERMAVTVLKVLARSAKANERPEARSVDSLTGLGDNATFASRLSDAFRAARVSAHPLGLILLDVDHLRKINDHLGYENGNEVLQKLAGILRVTVEDEDRIARLSGDDFAILLPGGGRGEARQLAAAVRSTVERFRFFPGGSTNLPRVTVSLGAASFPADADTEDELFDRARDALCEARSMGRNRVWCYLRRPRVPVQVPVYFDGSEPLLVGYTRDLSPSGIFLQTTEQIEVGMRCALAFPLPGQETKVHVVGRVVRTVLPVLAIDAETRIPGLGIEFERFGGSQDRRAIDAFLHARETSTLRPETGPLSVG